MAILHENFAQSTIANVGGIGAGDLSLDVQAGDGALFPAITGSDYFYCVLVKASGSREIVKVTARSTDTFTIARAQQGTSALAFDADDVVALRATAGSFEDILAEAEAYTDASPSGIGTTVPRLKMVDIGDWDMDSDGTTTVAHGLTLSKMRPPFSALIRNDDHSGVWPVALSPDTGNYPQDVYIVSIDATNINLARVASSGFDSSSFNATSYNRGWITMGYID